MSFTVFLCPFLAKPHSCLFIYFVYFTSKINKQECGLARKRHRNAVNMQDFADQRFELFKLL